MLKAAGEEHGFGVENLHTVRHEEDRISSTRIRDLLVAGDLREAEACLGRPYTICGRVAHGDKRGRTIGFPHHERGPAPQGEPAEHGVFAVKVLGLDEEPLPAVANIGNRPTVDRRRSLPAGDPYLRFRPEIYGEHVTVEFVQKIRDEKKFESFERCANRSRCTMRLRPGISWV